MKRCTDARVRAATGKRNGTGGDNDEDPIARNIFPLSVPTSLPLPRYRNHLLSVKLSCCGGKCCHVDLNVTVDITPIQSIAIVADAPRMLIVVLE
jgi:hypothetical protein